MDTDSNNEQRPNGDSVPHVTAREGDNSNVPKPKRLACMICRKRKLKCDGIKPSCSTCTRLGHDCAYDEVRRKSGPKRGYVKALEERLKQVETLLKTQEPAAAPKPNAANGIANGATPAERAMPKVNFHVSDPSINIANSRDKDRWQFNSESPPQPGSVDDFNFNSSMQMNMNPVDSNFTWEIINLGLEEPLPPQETIDELHQIYFEKIHPSLPMVHKYRYLAAMNLAPNQRPPVCLRYAMWTLACSVTEKYSDLKDLFYQRSRKYVESDYIKGFGEHLISCAHAQTHVLLANYEFKMMYFPRAWMSTGQAVRLCQMIGLHRLDGAGLDVKQCLPPPKDWTEREERRRTFWMAFAEDRYASIGTGWPMTIDERDIMTNLPSSETAFELSRPENTPSLAEAMTPFGAGKISPFGGIILMASLFGRNLIHLHRPDNDDKDHDLNGEFWKRHRNMDNILLNTALCLPGHLKLPAGLQNPNIVFTNMCIHTSTICLHQAAIFKADKHNLPGTVSSESKVRCITAANEIASIMRMVSHTDLSTMNPFVSFCLYVAARVFVQYLKSRPDDTQTGDSLRFLLAAMNALKRKNPLTESFLVQLDVDLEALGQRIPKLRTAFPRSADSPITVEDRTTNVRPGAPCDGQTASQSRNGIMAYRDECDFLKLNGQDSNPVNAPDLVPPEPSHARPSVSASDGMGSGWISDQGIPTRDRSTGHSPSVFTMPNLVYSGVNPMVSTSSGNSMSGFGHSDSGDGNDNSTSPDGQSNRPTPNSSCASDQRQQQQNGLAPSRMNTGSSRNSFDTSPVSPANQQQQMTQAEMERNVAAYFSDSVNGFSMSGTGLTPMMTADTPGGGGGGGGGPVGAGAADFSMPPGGWEIPGQTGMTPVSEGVLRTIMNMGPMETMDLGWDTNP